MSKQHKPIESETPSAFEQVYLSITEWVTTHGWIEIGQLEEYGSPMVRAIDEGGVVWEGEAQYASLDELWHDLETALAEWFEENG